MAKKATKKVSNIDPPNPVPYDDRGEEIRKQKLRGYRKYEGRTTGSRHGMGSNKYETFGGKQYRFRMPFGKYEDAGFYAVDKKSTGKVKDKYAKGVKSPGRAQPPRTGPGSGAGGHSARYSRLTGGGISKHGR